MHATDGWVLAATRFLPPSGTPNRAAVVMCPATGVPRGYYRAFAEFLAGAGFHVVTFDVRGIGGSRPAKLRGMKATMSEWGRVDIASAIRFARSQWPDLPLLAIGHSSGGWLLPFAPNAGEIRGALFVASQDGYYRRWPLLPRIGLGILWSTIVPASCTLMGRMPGRLAGSEDLPAGVAREWAKWCRRPEFIFGGPRGAEHAAAYAALRMPIVAYSFPDDSYAPGDSVDALIRRFTQARVTRRNPSPRELGQPIGHFGFFRPRFRETLWAEAERFLIRFAAETGPVAAEHEVARGAATAAGM
ncbi:MAG: alpha/beta hydrolase family protein [Thermoplasmatota archaeon]